MSSELDGVELRTTREGRLPSPIASLLILAVYVAVAGFASWHHELGRDEVRALNISVGARSIPDLFALLRNEGHPALFYLLLHAGYALTHSMKILKPLCLLLAAGGAFVFLRRAPFAPWQKALFLFGVFPLYFYAVLCRSYGLSMLLLFVVAALYPERRRRPWPLAIALVLLAHTNAYSFLLAVSLLLAIVVDRAFRRRHGYLALLSVLAGLALSAWTMLPDATTSVTSIRDRTAAELLGMLGSAIVTPGALYPMLAGGNEILANLLFFAVAVYLLTRPGLLVAWLAAGVSFSMFSRVVYLAGPLHLGLFYLFFITILWLSRTDGEERRLGGRVGRLQQAIARHRDTALALLLLAQACLAYGVVRADLESAYSSSESLGRTLTENPELRDAIVIAEPEVMAEALPYYAPNRIYLPREGQDMIRVSFTSAARRTLTLDELLEVADDLARRTGQLILLVVSHPLNPNGPFVIDYSNGLEFRYSPESLQRFSSRTIPLARFGDAMSDENYVLYRLR